MSDEVDAVLATVRERVTPDPEQRERLEAVASEVRERARAAVADLPVEADVVLVGSTARNTWLPVDRDVDVFVRFPPDLDRERLEEYGLTVGHAVVADGREEYAEHPYVVGTVDGFAVDLVPCYAVDSAAAIESAVDRTPFHTRYVTERLDDDLAAEVRLLKAFLSAIGVYGSDLKTRGFSGYLVELLVLEYGDARAVLSAAAEAWRPPITLDPADHAEETFDDPLVLVDPTDPDRNVAAVVHEDVLARFQHHARRFLADPNEDYFTPDRSQPATTTEVRATIDRRGTTPVAVVFHPPDLVEDQLWPQLRRSLEGVVGELERRGFSPLRSAIFVAERAVLFVECGVALLPAIERHEGPPVHVGDHAERFYAKYADVADVTGPYVEGGRYVVERERAFRTPAALLESDAIFEVALGATVADILAGESGTDEDGPADGGYRVLSGTDVATLAEEFGTDLADYFAPKP